VASLDELLLCVKKRKGQNLVQLRQNRVLQNLVRCFTAEFFFYGSCLLGQQQKSKAANIYRRGNLLAKRQPDLPERRPTAEREAEDVIDRTWNCTAERERAGGGAYREISEKEGAALEGKYGFQPSSSAGDVTERTCRERRAEHGTVRQREREQGGSVQRNFRERGGSVGGEIWVSAEREAGAALTGLAERGELGQRTVKFQRKRGAVLRWC
jgi:hypothetical protein